MKIRQEVEKEKDMTGNRDDWTIKEIVEQLELVGYTDNLGHKLEMNSAFKSLKERAEAEIQSGYWLGREVYADGKKVNVLSLKALGALNGVGVEVRVTEDMPSDCHTGGRFINYEELLTPEGQKGKEIAEAKAILKKYDE